MNAPVYAIGDIHGQYENLCQVLDRIEADGGPDAKIIFLGDLTDRGPKSKQVVQHLMDGCSAGRNWTVIRGNHDQMFADFMDPMPRIEMRLPLGLDWLHDRLGGQDTLRSYGVEINETSRYYQIHQDAQTKVPADHHEFLRSLPLFHQIGQYLFVHAGIHPERPLDQQKHEDLIWIREPFLSYDKPHPFVVVHGHTAIQQATHYGNRINLDSGAGYGRGMSTLVIEGNETWLLGPNGRNTFKP